VGGTGPDLQEIAAWPGVEETSSYSIPEVVLKVKEEEKQEHGELS
jgi:hypothetical protein